MTGSLIREGNISLWTVKPYVTHVEMVVSPHLMNAFDDHVRLALAQYQAADKGNAISALPELIKKAIVLRERLSSLMSLANRDKLQNSSLRRPGTVEGLIAIGRVKSIGHVSGKESR